MNSFHYTHTHTHTHTHTKEQKSKYETQQWHKTEWTGFLVVKVKVNLSLCFNWAPRHEGVLALGGGEWSASRPQGKNPWCPLGRKLGGPQCRSGCGGEEKNSQNPDRPALSIPTELSRLLLNVQVKVLYYSSIMWYLARAPEPQVVYAWFSDGWVPVRSRVYQIAVLWNGTS